MLYSSVYPVTCTHSHSEKTVFHRNIFHCMYVVSVKVSVKGVKYILISSDAALMVMFILFLGIKKKL